MKTQAALKYPDCDLRNMVCYSFKTNLDEAQNNSTAVNIAHLAEDELNHLICLFLLLTL